MVRCYVFAREMFNLYQLVCIHLTSGFLKHTADSRVDMKFHWANCGSQTKNLGFTEGGVPARHRGGISEPPKQIHDIESLYLNT